MSLSISPEMERRLAEQASAAGYSSVEAYLAALISQADEGISSSSAITIPSEELDALFERLAFDEPAPPLPPDFSRADIYLDHD